VTDALRNAQARAAREAVFRDTSKKVKLPLKDVPDGTGHLAKPSDYIALYDLSWGQKLDELTPAARATSGQSLARCAMARNMGENE
jgi:hypothetical protein